MAGGYVKYRALGRSSAHRQALLRNLVTSLIEHESISTTWEKAKEAQRLAEKLITLGKKNTNASRTKAQAIFYNPARPEHMTKLFTTLKTRYLSRPGGYTRVLRIEPIKEDQAPSAILELVDGPKDMRFAMTAKSIANARSQGKQKINDMTAANVMKVTRFRREGERDLEEMIGRFERLRAEGDEGVKEVGKKRVYPEQQRSR